METPKLTKVLRLDSIPLDEAYWTEEGYLRDRPIVTKVGIFEYIKKDGTIRRELRLPEWVFEPASLASYKGKPIIITHSAGYVSKNNVGRESVGTIISEGYQDGENVRAEIVIHDTDSLKAAGLKELSLGYELDLVEEPGVWNGQPYDAIQTNIRINHLALVANARAGDQARLNIDESDKKGETDAMKKVNTDEGVTMTPEEIGEAITQYQENKAAGAEGAPAAAPAGDGEGAQSSVVPAGEGMAPAAAPDALQLIKDRKDRRDSEGIPEDPEQQKALITQMDADIAELIGLLEAAEAKSDFEKAPTAQADGAGCGTDKADGEDPTNANAAEPAKAVNADSKSEAAEWLRIARAADKLNLDGDSILSMSKTDAKKTIIKAVRPDMRLDGKSETYINAAYDLSVKEIGSRKTTDDQRKQMFNTDGAKKFAEKINQAPTGAAQARQRMLDKRNGGNN